MKKIIALLMILNATFGYSIYIPNTSHNLYFFNGIGDTLNKDGGNDPNFEEMSTTVAPLSDQLDYVYDIFKLQSPNIIAHSQGGVRALALAARMSDDTAYHGQYSVGDYYNVNEIITIGSPVKGYSPLLNGREVLMSKVDHIIGEISEGIGALNPWSVLIGPESFRLKSDHVFFFMNCMGVGEDNELFSSIQDGSAFYKGGIADLNPNSHFFHSELTPYNTLVKSEELVREPTGNVTVEIINGSVTVIPEYIYYYETVYTQEVVRPLSSETKLGMIVGQNNDPMTLPLITDSQKESLDDLNFALEFAEGYYLGATFATFYSIIYIPLTFQFSDMLYAVKHALKYTQNPENIIRDVIGSDKNDCLILESDQTIDPSYYGATGISGDGNDILLTNANHLDEVYHGDIWSGIGYELPQYGARGTKVMYGPGSILDRWSSSPADVYGTVVK